MFQSLFGRARAANRKIADDIYGAIVAAARQEVFYSHWQVPDSPLGRFEMLSLHMFLFQHRMRDNAGGPRELSQLLIDDFFLDVDHSLRELGIGDMGVPKRMKKLARMFYGRTASYAAALESGDRAALAAALARNVRPGVSDWPEADALADYVVEADAWLGAAALDDILAGKLDFPVAQPITPAMRGSDDQPC